LTTRTDRESMDNATWRSPTIGMLCWEQGRIAYGLEQLSTLPGNATNPATFSFPVKYERINGATFETTVEKPNRKILQRMIEAAQKMEKDGIQAITTSCGFNALFQRELANSVNVPVFTSSLLQVPLVCRLLKEEQAIGIITAYKSFLTRDHLSAVGIDSSIPIRIVGLEKTTVFSGISTGSTTPFSIREFQEQLMEIVKEFLKEEQNLGAIVLECTDLPPFAADIRKMSGLPVFDIVTLTNFIYDSSRSRQGTGWL